MATAPTTPVLEVERAAIATTRIVDDPLDILAEGSVRLRVDRFAVTANTITYALFGDLLGYWDFFPTVDSTWGRVPAMGWADVVGSAHPDVEPGMRCYGWFPMAGHVDVAVTPTAEGLRDDSPHRRAHAPVYRALVDQRRDPLWRAGPDDDVGDLEDRHALLRGLFLTGYLADAYFDAQDWFGADTAVVLSASSKTAIGFASCAARRGLDALIGVTSPGNVGFVRELGLYTDVVTYDQVAGIDAATAVAVDMAGHGAAIAALHEHLGDRIAHSMVVGKSHNDAPPAEVTAGPTPELFFAPTAVALLTERGIDPSAIQQGSALALAEFIAGSHRWLRVERSAGPEAATQTWAAVHAGDVAPDVGRITSLHG